MNRGERRHRTDLIAKKRFRQLYCEYHGTPEAWFFRAFNEEERLKKFGECRDKRYSWSCRCSWCMGWVQRRQDIADQDFRDQYDEAVEDGSVEVPPPKIPDMSNTGPFDIDHENWMRNVKPWPMSWRMPNRFHHPSERIHTPHFQERTRSG